MKTILFATDFSLNSIHAIRYGLELFKGTGARYILFNAYTDPSAGNTMTLWYDDVMRDVSTTMLNKVHEELIEKYDQADLDMELISGFGDLPYAPGPILKQYDVDLIIMGASGAGGTGNVLFGSSAYSTMKDSPCPVLSVPLQTPIAVPGNIGLACEKIMSGKEEVLAPMLEIAQLHGATIMGVKVTSGVHDASPGSDGPDDLLPIIELKADDPLGGIESAIGEYDIDLLTIIIPERRFLDRLFHKSVSKQIVNRIALPILALHGR